MTAPPTHKSVLEVIEYVGEQAGWRDSRRPDNRGPFSADNVLEAFLVDRLVGHHVEWLRC